jgi:transglutaminase-like putative cysteine protease
MTDAILEVNHWCHEKVTYKPSDGRTSSPLQVVRTSWGRCGEESTFCVSALRAVGIPARQVYTPRWAHTDDNHAWVEAWADGKWWFLGACEPEPVLNLGWFNANAARVLLTHTNAFGYYDGPEEVLVKGPNYTTINLTSNYAPVSDVTIRVMDGEMPVEGADVRFCIYNYAEFYPAVLKKSDAEGEASLTAGRGDMLAWASKDGKFAYSKLSVGKDSLVCLKLSDAWVDIPEAIDIIPPVPGGSEPEVTPEQRAENDRRFAYEDSVRTAYMNTFVKDGDPLVSASEGNYKVIGDFLAAHPDERARELLGSLSLKDLRDVTMEVLEDSYTATESILCPRVENEFLVPYKHWFLSNIPAVQQETLRNVEALRKFVTDSIKVLETPYAWTIPQSPISVWQTRRCYANSRDIFFVSLARTLGIDARKNPITGKVQTRREGGDWSDVNFTPTSAPKGKGTLKLSYSGKAIPNPEYYTHFTISKIENGVPKLFSFDDGELYTGGGSGFKERFAGGIFLEEGAYMLTSGARLSDGSVPVTLQFFTVNADKTTKTELILRETLLSGSDAILAAPLKYGEEADAAQITSIQAQ